MRTERLTAVVRMLSESEKRAFRRSLERRRHRLRVASRDVTLSGILLFTGGLLIPTIVHRGTLPFFSIALWFAICAAIGSWTLIRSRRHLGAQIERLERALRRNEAREFSIQSSEMVEFEELEDEGACYAFQLNEGRIVFVRGQEYYPSARFPNTDFSLSVIYDETGIPIEELIHKRGRKLEPTRVIPAKFKSEMLIPAHLEMIEGKLPELESLLTIDCQSGNPRIATHA
jgi:hypothetical protein